MARVLVVDDSQLARELIRDTIMECAATLYKSQWELRFTLVEDAVGALNVIQEHNFELIITDILMAKMDGWELIRQIRKRFPQFETPIVVVSAIQGVDLEYECMRHGASAWFSKPIKEKEFAAGIFKLIQER
jgi:CheY-like chemotaxis protein